MVLEHPEIPLHTNGSENDIRAQVTRRKVSGGTRSDGGRDCRDGFVVKRTTRSDRLYQPLFEANALKYLIEEVCVPSQERCS
jgi:hypothetical protein